MNPSNHRFTPEPDTKPASALPNTHSEVPVRDTRPRSEIRCGSMTVSLGRTPLVMGILNVTPDSFSDGGQHVDPRAAVSHALDMCAAGAHIVDVGGESTRPGSDPVTAGVELDRVLPVIAALSEARERGVPISIDTRRAEVADAALRRGCHMINDVSATSDPEMVEVLRNHPGVPIVLMHMKGDPKAMQETPYYDDVVAEVAGNVSLLGRAKKRTLRFREPTAGTSRVLETAQAGRGSGRADP